MPCLRLLTLLLAFNLVRVAAHAQQSEYASWEDFLEAYTEEVADPDNDYRSGTLADLEALHLNPININQATREDILRIPFVSEAVADSIISYRQRRHGFFTLGELKFILPLYARERSYLPFFVYAGEVSTDSLRALRTDSLRQYFRQGRHRVYTRFDVPLEKFAKPMTGPALANTLRYNYNYLGRLRYGATLQKDVGEPFGVRGSHTYPYDYTSLHFYLNHANWTIAAGDYRINIGQGLLVGNANYASRAGLLSSMVRQPFRLTPHSSTEESNFFRGIAGSYTWMKQQQSASPWDAGRATTVRSLQLTAFVSHRGLDGTLNDDVVTSFKTDGYHRTLGELDKRNTVRNTTAGLNLLFTQGAWWVGLAGVWSHYNRIIQPALHDYNLYYLRGQDAAGLSAQYGYRHGPWQVQGEVALDKRAHLATSHTLRWQRSQLAAYAQVRALTPRYVSPWGSSIAQNSHLQNEYAALAGARWQTRLPLTLESYAEYVYFPRPSYRALAHAHGGLLYAKMLWNVARQHNLSLRYNVKLKQRTVTGYNLMENTGTHRLKLQWDGVWLSGKLKTSAAADGALFASQTSTAKFGGMLSARATWKPVKSLSVSASSGLFFSDSYDARLYAYQPHLPLSSTIYSYAYHGCNVLALAEWKPLRWLSLGAQYDMLHYFNRSTCGSAPLLVSGSTRSNFRLSAMLLF